MTRENFFLILLVYLNKDAVVLPGGFKESDEDHGMVQKNHRTLKKILIKYPRKAVFWKKEASFLQQEKEA